MSQLSFFGEVTRLQSGCACTFPNREPSPRYFDTPGIPRDTQSPCVVAITSIGLTNAMISVLSYRSFAFSLICMVVELLAY